jgi:hypothetical protein
MDGALLKLSVEEDREGNRSRVTGLGESRGGTACRTFDDAGMSIIASLAETRSE